MMGFIERLLWRINIVTRLDTVAATLEEGGTWYEFPLGRPTSPKGWCVHSILFADGSIWDAQSGWRPKSTGEYETWIMRRSGKLEKWVTSL